MVHAIKGPGPRNMGTSRCPEEFHPFKIRIGTGRTPTGSHSYFASIMTMCAFEATMMYLVSSLVQSLDDCEVPFSRSTHFLKHVHHLKLVARKRLRIRWARCRSWYKPKRREGEGGQTWLQIPAPPGRPGSSPSRSPG